VRENDAIYHEDLQTVNLVKNRHLAKSIQDAGWSAFLTILSYKAACASRSVVAVPPAYTSQTCSGCGAMVQKGLSVCWRSCPDCGTSLHRDHSAAKNREWLGQSLAGSRGVGCGGEPRISRMYAGECQDENARCTCSIGSISSVGSMGERLDQQACHVRCQRATLARRV
jgi:IS605 OrfB family transposase